MKLRTIFGVMLIVVSLLIAGCGLQPGKSAFAGQAIKGDTSELSQKPCDYEWFIGERTDCTYGYGYGPLTGPGWCATPGDTSLFTGKSKTSPVYTFNLQGPRRGCSRFEDYKWCPEYKDNVKQVYVKGTGKYTECSTNTAETSCYGGEWYYYNPQAKTMVGPIVGCTTEDSSSYWCPLKGSTVPKVMFEPGTGTKLTNCQTTELPPRRKWDNRI